MKNFIVELKKWASYLQRTATTIYPCFLPNLGEFTGAGRIRLARRKCNCIAFPFLMNYIKKLKSYAKGFIYLYKYLNG